MNKTIRLLLVVILFVGVVAVAGKNAWASPVVPAPAAKVDAGVAQANPQVGTVVVPEHGSVVRVQHKSCPENVSGAATLCGLETGTDVVASLDPQPAGYLSKIVNLAFAGGSAKLCFPALHGTEKIYFNQMGVWTQVSTFYESNKACAIVSISGQYVLGK